MQVYISVQYVQQLSAWSPSDLFMSLGPLKYLSVYCRTHLAKLTYFSVFLMWHWVKHGMEWNGLEWNGMEWNGLEWNGMEWNGMDWNGMEWNGILSGTFSFHLKPLPTKPDCPP